MISKRRLVVEMQYAHSGVDRQYPCRSIYPLACDVTEVRVRGKLETPSHLDTVYFSDPTAQVT